MKVYFSHTGYNKYLPEVEISNATTLKETIESVAAIHEYEGIKAVILSTSGKILSSVRIFSNVEVIYEKHLDNNLIKFYESEKTKEITSLNTVLSADTPNILITIFNPTQLLELINTSQAEQNGDEAFFEYIDQMGTGKRNRYKPIIDKIDFDFDIKKEDIFGFRIGECSLESLKIDNGKEARISFVADKFDKDNSKLIPDDLVEAIRDIWDLPSGVGNLRLFQEDSLFFIMSRLMDMPYPKEKQLLLSMPTGGGKTEAFMIPLLSHIYLEKINGATDGIKSIIIYPTNALANDQALRFVDLIYKVNRRLSDNGVPRNRHISIGILSGDTPNKSTDLKEESLIKICPKCGKSDKWKVDNGTLLCINAMQDGSICGTRLDFCRLKKEDILENPPDILITNPDEINFALHSPKYLPLFKNQIKSIVFDEVHIYQGIFGCHISHLLRRLEEAIAYKPLYIGMSATIGNAVELAALLFDESKENIRYIQNDSGRYLTEEITKTRYHALIKPYLRGVQRTRSGKERSKYVRTLSVAGSIGMFIGHLISDSHFRKSIIFTNYRSEADDLAGYMRERERLDIKQYFNEILDKLALSQSLSEEEIEICEYMHKWFTVIMQETKNINPESIIGWNRGGLEKKDRIRSVHSFGQNNVIADKDADDAFPIDLMVATKSLEVGIDIGDVTTVINSSAPFTVNEYVQRVGRGGRKKDSLAITVINPENAIDSHLRKHFSEYVEARPGSFEDAPIIINNEIIIERHIKARIADCLTSLYISQAPGPYGVGLSIGNILDDITLIQSGKRLQIGDGISDQKALEYARSIYELIFGVEINSERVDERLIQFVGKESTILGTKPSALTTDHLRDWVNEVILELNRHLQLNARKKWEKNSFLTGYGSVMPSISTSLRGSGSNVTLYIGDSDNPIDTVSRQTAFNSMPLAAEGAVSTTKSGISTFRIVDDKNEEDYDAITAIKQKIYGTASRKEYDYFSRKLEDFPDYDEVSYRLNILVPRKLRVSYFPSRFYCIQCKKALIPNTDYEERDDGVYCKKCGHKAQQLHKAYMCADDECGKLFDPPAPKMCINPNCSATKEAFKIYQNNGYHYSVEVLKQFKFRLTKDLEWVCQSCGCKMNFSSYAKLYQHNKQVVAERIRQLTQDDRKTIEGMCFRALRFPETMHFHNALKAQFWCTTQGHKSIKTVGVPRVRTVAYSFIGNKMDVDEPIVLCDGISNNDSIVTFTQGYVIQLANEFMRRFSSGQGDSETFTLKTERIFDHKYWGNYYESHLAWISFGDKLDKFINDKKYSCSGDCATCTRFNDPIALDLGVMMKPQCALEDYNFDVTNNKPKKPDHRGRFCELAKQNICTEQCCVRYDTHEICEHFDVRNFLRYLVVHTIKHGILWALPKYAGVSVSEIKGEIYPNDNESGYDLVLIDSNEGGSGAIPLIQKHWDEIWKFASEVIELTASNEANIILPHTCSRNNADLCPFIAKDYLEFISL